MENLYQQRCLFSTGEVWDFLTVFRFWNAVLLTVTWLPPQTWKVCSSNVLSTPRNLTGMVHWKQQVFLSSLCALAGRQWIEFWPLPSSNPETGVFVVLLLRVRVFEELKSSQYCIYLKSEMHISIPFEYMAESRGKVCLLTFRLSDKNK